MFLENLVVDALEPQRLGRFWEAAVGGVLLTDEPAGYETRLEVRGGPVLDLCFQRVPDPAVASSRLHVELSAPDVDAEVARLVALGAQRRDAGLTDPEGGPFTVVAGPDRQLATLRLESADPDRDAAFWSWLTGWRGDAGALRHASVLGPVLQLVPEAAPKRVKNRSHLDVRLEADDDLAALAAGIARRGGGELRTDWGALPWTSFTDPSGNELCLLPARS